MQSRVSDTPDSRILALPSTLQSTQGKLTISTVMHSNACGADFVVVKNVRTKSFGGGRCGLVPDPGICKRKDCWSKTRVETEDS